MEVYRSHKRARENSEKLATLSKAYVAARDVAERLRRENDARAKHFGRGGDSGAYHTPLEVVRAVSEWKRSAIAVSEHVAEILSRRAGR